MMPLRIWLRALFSIVFSIILAGCAPTLRPIPPGIMSTDSPNHYAPLAEVMPDGPQLRALWRHQQAIAAGREHLGCIDRPAVQCLASLGAMNTVVLSPPQFKGQSMLGDTVDPLNGAPQRKDAIFATLIVGRDGRLQSYPFNLRTDQSELHYVNSVEINLDFISNAPRAIRSPDDLKPYPIFSFIYPIVAKECPSIQENQINTIVYKFITGYKISENERTFCGIQVGLIGETWRGRLTFSRY